MKYKFTFCSNVFLLLMSIGVTACSGEDPTRIQESVEARVEATLTSESAIKATVEAGVETKMAANVTALPVIETPPPLPPETPVPALTPSVTPAFPPSKSPSPGLLQPSESPVLTETITPAHTPDQLTIIEPIDGAEVPRVIRLSGSGAQAALQPDTFLNIIVTTRTGEHWVQTMPLIESDGDWSSSPVYIGALALGIGETFLVCAVLADQQLEVGRTFEYPPTAPACINVVRM